MEFLVLKFLFFKQGKWDKNKHRYREPSSDNHRTEDAGEGKMGTGDVLLTEGKYILAGPKINK